MYEYLESKAPPQWRLKLKTQYVVRCFLLGHMDCQDVALEASLQHLTFKKVTVGPEGPRGMQKNNTLFSNQRW